MSEIKGLLKAILYVQDMDAQVRFYRDVLGLTVKYPNNLQSYAHEFWVEFDTGQCSLVLHGGSEMRLGADTPKLAFAVDNIEEARAVLMQRGAQLVAVREPALGVRVVDGTDPEGNPFSLDWHA